MNRKTHKAIREFKKLEQEKKAYDRKRHLSKDPEKAALENVMFDLAEEIKKQGIE
jgi:hypothetical protein